MLFDRADQKFKFALDRKSTRLNSSHLVISYAVFCLKKKNYASRRRGRIRGRSRLPSPMIQRTATQGDTNAAATHRRSAASIPADSAPRELTMSLPLHTVNSIQTSAHDNYADDAYSCHRDCTDTIATQSKTGEYLSSSFDGTIPFIAVQEFNSSFFFFFKNTAPPEISPLPLHDALPIPASPVGTRKVKSARAFQYRSASERASRGTMSGLVPVTTTAALQRGSSAHAYPIHTAASIKIGRAHV